MPQLKIKAPTTRFDVPQGGEDTNTDLSTNTVVVIVAAVIVIAIVATKMVGGLTSPRVKCFANTRLGVCRAASHEEPYLSRPWLGTFVIHSGA